MERKRFAPRPELRRRRRVRKGVGRRDRRYRNEDEFWRDVFASNPAPLAAGFQYLVWMGDASMEDKTRAMWYSYLGDLARLGVRLEPDDVLHMSRASELMGRLLCGS